jgi:hypothetical protein
MVSLWYPLLDIIPYDHQPTRYPDVIDWDREFGLWLSWAPGQLPWWAPIWSLSGQHADIQRKTWNKTSNRFNTKLDHSLYIYTYLMMHLYIINISKCHTIGYPRNTKQNPNGGGWSAAEPWGRYSFAFAVLNPPCFDDSPSCKPQFLGYNLEETHLPGELSHL